MCLCPRHKNYNLPPAGWAAHTAIQRQAQGLWAPLPSSSGVTALRESSDDVVYRFETCKTLGPNPNSSKEQGPREGVLGFLLESSSDISLGGSTRLQGLTGTQDLYPLILTGGDLQCWPTVVFLSFNLNCYHLLVRIIRPVSSKKQDFILKNKDLIEIFIRL